MEGACSVAGTRLIYPAPAPASAPAVAHFLSSSPAAAFSSGSLRLLQYHLSSLPRHQLELGRRHAAPRHLRTALLFHGTHPTRRDSSAVDNQRPQSPSSSTLPDSQTATRTRTRTRTGIQLPAQTSSTFPHPPDNANPQVQLSLDRVGAIGRPPQVLPDLVLIVLIVGFCFCDARYAKCVSCATNINAKKRKASRAKAALRSSINQSTSFRSRTRPARFSHFLSP